MMSIRYKLWLSFAPLLLLLAILGGAAVYHLGVVGNRIEEILRENYRSVDAMGGLYESIERIDSCFQFEISGETSTQLRYEKAWSDYYKHYDIERNNITEPGEAELVLLLTQLTERYQSEGDLFFSKTRTAEQRKNDYYGSNGKPGQLRITFHELKKVSGDIRRLNQTSMERASVKARSSAVNARYWATIGLIVALVTTGLLAWLTTRTLLRPIDALRRSATAVGDGKFGQILTVETRDEIGELVEAFNRMTVQLRDLKQSQASRLLRAQQASQAAIDAFPDPILVVDPDGRVEMANPAARRILGVIPNDDSANVQWDPPENLRVPLIDALQGQKTYLTQSFDQSVTYRVGNEDHIYVPQVLPVRDPYENTLGAAVVLNDVTRFRLLDEFKSDLVATASHELKTPLAGLRLAVHLLLQEVVGPLTDKQSELLVDARDNTERLVRIVDHLLSLARLENSREPLAIRPEDPVKLLHDAANRIQAMVTGKKLLVDLNRDIPLPFVAADAQRIGHALDNLLVNANNYTGAGGQITLSARVLDDGKVELSVSDTGIGIAPEHVPHVFDKFFRIPGQTRGEGTGLGLAIVKEVATAHGGEITCESQLGKGTTFRLKLPVSGGPK